MIYFIIVIASCLRLVCKAQPIDYLPLEMGPESFNEIIERYFTLGFEYLEIVGFLSLYHGINIGLRQLKRILRAKGLRRRSPKDDLITVYSVIESEIEGTGANLGYRGMHNRLKKLHNIVIDKETVRLLMKSIDPDGVECRRRHRLKRRQYHVPGPNYLWHIDGWDKLKPYGICIHGCIDGFSRKIIWLEASATNNDPFVIGRYFSDCIYKVGGCPLVVRADRGTENGNVELLQSLLRTESDAQPTVNCSFLYGKSTANQRIESFWSKVRSAGLETFIDHFHGMSSVGIIDTSSELDIECVRFCYSELVRKELKNIVMLWNTHHIRKIRNSEVPYGKPDIMYHFPEMFGGRDYLQAVSVNHLGMFAEVLTSEPRDCDSNKVALFRHLMEDGSKQMPNTIEEASRLLIYLLDMIEYHSNT